MFAPSDHFLHAEGEALPHEVDVQTVREALSRSSACPAPVSGAVYDSLLNDRAALDTLGNSIYEAPFASVLDKPLNGPGVTLFEALSATGYVVPAIEIIDARIEQFDRDTRAIRKVFNTIIDFAANAGIVLGDRPVKPMAVDPRWVGAMLHKNGVIEGTGLAVDLSASIGYRGQANHPEVQHAILDGIRTVRAAGKAAGVLMANRELHRPISMPTHCSSRRASTRHCSFRPRQGWPAISLEKTPKSEIVTQSRRAGTKPASRPGARHTQPSRAVSFGSSQVTHI